MSKVIVAVLMIVSLMGCAGSPESKDSKRLAEPDWVSNPGSAYPDSKYVSAVGYGTSRDNSEKNALGALVAIFGQTVKGETKASYKYQEAVIDGLLNSQENRDIDSAVKTSFAMDSLIGAEIKDVWFDGKDTYYAIAVMDKLKSSMLYGDLIDSNLKLIGTLTNLPAAEKNTFTGYGCYNMAATIADANSVFINVLSVLSPASAASYRMNAVSGDQYRLEALQITKNIPVTITVDKDYSGKIKGVFSEVYANMGFKTGGDNSPYELLISVSMEEAVLNNPNKFVRYNIKADLTEKNTSLVLFPYNINGREGSTSMSEAENRALRIIDQRIREAYADELKEYMAGLSPKGK